jgi:hypothetical protein
LTLPGDLLALAALVHVRGSFASDRDDVYVEVLRVV